MRYGDGVTEQASARAETLLASPLLWRRLSLCIPAKWCILGFLGIYAELSTRRGVISSAQPLAVPLQSTFQHSFICTRCAGEAVGFLFFASKSVDLLPFFKSVNSCNRSHQLAQANRAKVLPSSSPTAYCEESCALLLRRLLERLWS